jgi:hypothetical protein
MTVEVIPAEVIRAITLRVDAARQQASVDNPATRDAAADPEHWQNVFETNAAALLGALERVHITDDYVVRYRFFDFAGGDPRLRPFVARRGVDVSAVRGLLDWHPPPDSSSALRLRPNRDAELLYRHFRFEASAAGYFEYWIAMQELWASARWIHSRIVIDAPHFAELMSGAGWQLHHEVESYQPLCLRAAHEAHLAMLVYCPLQRHSIALQRVSIDSAQTITFAEPITVATGPRGYYV